MANRHLNRLFPNSINRSLRAKVTIGIIVPMVLMLGIFTWFEYTHHRSVLMQNLSVLASYNGQIIEQILRHSMLSSDITEVQTTLNTVGNAEIFRVVYLMDTTGKVIFAPNGVGTGLQLDNRSPTCQPCHKLATNERASSVMVSEEDGQRVFRSMHPIEITPECSQCHDPQQRLLGLLLTDITMEPFESAFITDLRENFLWGIRSILVSAILVNLVMGRIVILAL